MGLYHDNKSAVVGSEIECPVCHRKFKKVQYSQAFCSLECKDRFWNANRGNVKPHDASSKSDILQQIVSELKRRIELYHNRAVTAIAMDGNDYDAESQESALSSMLLFIDSIINVTSGADEGFHTEHFGFMFPAWIDAPSTLQPSHKFHGMNVVACHLKKGGYRIVPLNAPVSFEVCENTHLVDGWRCIDPFRTCVNSILKMCDTYENNGEFSDSRAIDFLGNVRVKCKDAIQYDETEANERGL